MANMAARGEKPDLGQILGWASAAGMAAAEAGDIMPKGTDIGANSTSSTTRTDLYAFGPKSAPSPPKVGKDAFPDPEGIVGPERAPFPREKSTFGDPVQAPLSGHYHKLPKGTKLPNGIDVVADGLDVDKASPHPPTHHTLFPAEAMPLDEYTEKINTLPWSYAGKK